jgi:hypothetical protein
MNIFPADLTTPRRTMLRRNDVSQNASDLIFSTVEAAVNGSILEECAIGSRLGTVASFCGHGDESGSFTEGFVSRILSCLCFSHKTNRQTKLH